jgi:hypothetical protein
LSHVLSIFVCLSLVLCGFTKPTNREEAKIPVIYSTDIYFPIEDGDDVFDLAAIYSLPGIDIKGILLNKGNIQKDRPGTHQISQLNGLSGKNVPSFFGLESKLKTTDDHADDQIYQEGVQFIINTLRDSDSRVDLVSVGSLTDIAAAYNRDPVLFKEKAGKILIFIGEASKENYMEYNVELDPNAYAAVMNSGLNIYWVPCFDGGLWNNVNGNASYWYMKDQTKLLAGVDRTLIKYFTYSLVADTIEQKRFPIPFLYTPINKDDEIKLLSLKRNLWCTAVFKILTDTHNKEIFDFKETRIHVNNDGTFKLNDTSGNYVHQFYIKSLVDYADKMTEETNNILINFPIMSLPGLFFYCLKLDWGLNA